ncbi:MAG TPA: transketolase [Bacteroidales bacterium]|jgi:transketolase|nr:transketolase [Bacteroidota bacterium]OQC62055.1 MAG: Transketolase [Bacteroidetes bacterium ADurb.Bin012]HNQ58909.1 transketolase [Bacteroidales bacterium]HNU22132.1 transketolase [Bacteroidales bacterium]HNV16159.1 transketolase [Bacteroidales bacterium]
MNLTTNIDRRAADNLRALIVAMVEKAKSGHPGGAMGAADFIHILYSEYLRFDPSDPNCIPNDPNWIARDRFFLDPGHLSALLYAVLTLCGKFSLDDLQNFRQLGGSTPGHPEKNIQRGIENTSGPLGQGHAMAVGAAIAERFLAARFGKVVEHKTIALISDGGIQEEISQGAGRLAGHLGLHNLIMFYDANNVQLSTKVDEVSSENTAMKYRAWGWKVLEIDGNDPEEIRQALDAAWAETKSPTLIIGHTIMGKGIKNKEGKSMEGLVSTHGKPISKAGADVTITLRGLGADPQHPFAIFPDVEEHYLKVLNRKKEEARKAKETFDEWKEQNPKLADELRQYFDKIQPEINWDAIHLSMNVATRVSSAEVLSVFSQTLGNMLVMSADLANSDRTDGFLSHTQPIVLGDFNGAFLHVGVSELTMASLANGMALHGGVIPVCGTFMVFSDYMKPAIRLAALMELRVIYVWSHDSFRVGEDGPTHQPVEQEAQIRLLEQLKNHSNQRSFIALRPADQAETLEAWKFALQNKNRPTGILLSRQNVKTLPPLPFERRRKEAVNLHHGAYLIRKISDSPDIILLGNGSDVALLLEASDILFNQYQIKTNLISAPSEGLFREQSTEYQHSILPEEIPIFVLTSGLPSTFQTLAGSKGRIFGLEQFGYSAPAEILETHFGFTPQNIAKEVMNLLDEINNNE